MKHSGWCPPIFENKVFFAIHMTIDRAILNMWNKVRLGQKNGPVLFYIAWPLRGVPPTNLSDNCFCIMDCWSCALALIFVAQATHHRDQPTSISLGAPNGQRNSGVKGELKESSGYPKRERESPLIETKKKKVLTRMDELVDSSKINAPMYYHLIYIYHKHDFKMMKTVNHFEQS